MISSFSLSSLFSSDGFLKFDKMEDIQHKLLLFIEKSKDEQNYQNLILIFNDYKIRDNQYKHKNLLILISKISDNH